MEAKFVYNVLFEKFEAESDPIKDMGIGWKTKYRIFQADKEWNSSKVLQYSVIKRNIFGKMVEKWYNVPKPLSKKNKRDKRYDEKSEKQHVSYYYIDGSDKYECLKFIKQWPNINNYLKWLKETEEEMELERKRQKQAEEDARYDYLN